MPFLGGLLEVFFGLLGLYVGFAALLLRWYNTGFTKLVMANQTLFGYYVFVLFVFALPAVGAANLTVDTHPPRFIKGLSLFQNRFIVWMGILTSFHFCLALQGSQFVFFARFVSAATRRDFLRQQSGNKRRSVFWDMNLTLSVLWKLINCALIHAELCGGRLPAPYLPPPNVGRIPGMTITAGILMLLWCLVSAFFGMSGGSVPSAYYYGSAFVYLFAFLNFTIVQFEQLDFTDPSAGPIDGASALHAWLVFMVATLGPYFVNQEDSERNGETY